MRGGMAGLAAALALALTACAGGGGGALNIMEMQRRLDDRGISFGVTRIPGESAALFQIRFRTSDAGDEAGEGLVTDADFQQAAQAAAPDGCTLVRLEPAGEGAMKAVYDC